MTTFQWPGYTAINDSLFHHHYWPDWQDESSYDYLWVDRPSRRPQTSLFMGWEFLRRNTAYQDAFSKFLLRWVKWCPISNTTEMPGDLKEMHDEICLQFGIVALFGLRHPASISAPTFIDEYQPNVDLIAHWIDGEKINLEIGNEPKGLCMDVRIVADRRLEEQFENIKLMFNSLTDTHGNRIPAAWEHCRKQEEKYPIYLRVHDAFRAGIDDTAIAKPIYGNDSGGYDRVKKQRTRAEMLVEGGYLDLVRPYRGVQKGI